MNKHEAYVIPCDDLHYTINFSGGGRSSAFMLYHILCANGGLPENVQVVFANTGKELDATLDFVHRIETSWKVDIAWLEYDYDSEARGGRAAPKNIHRVVDYATASRQGEPFETMIRSRNYLPNVVQRICTSELKVATIERYMVRDKGIKRTSIRNILGIRYDEKHRWGKALNKHCRTIWPMVYAQHTKADVLRFWDSHQPFDLALDRDSVQGNCDLCFLKGRKKLEYLVRRKPELINWWIDQENYVAGVRHISRHAVFNKQFSYTDLLRDIERQAEIPMEFDGDEYDQVSCFCGD